MARSYALNVENGGSNPSSSDFIMKEKILTKQEEYQELKDKRDHIKHQYDVAIADASKYLNELDEIKKQIIKLENE